MSQASGILMSGCCAAWEYKGSGNKRTTQNTEDLRHTPGSLTSCQTNKHVNGPNVAVGCSLSIYKYLLLLQLLTPDP